MNEKPENKLIQYHNGRIVGWDLMSWASTVDRNIVTDTEALEALIHLDDFYADGYHKCVEALILRTIPEKHRRHLGEILILAAFTQLDNGSISSPKFVSLFLDTFYNEIDNSTEPCADWIYKVFNENNGYGFLNMEAMKSQDLANYIKSEITG